MMRVLSSFEVGRRSLHGCSLLS